MPAPGFGSSQFAFNNLAGEEKKTMSIGSGSLMGDPSMPRLQFRDWMGQVQGQENAINNDSKLLPVIEERIDLELTIPDPTVISNSSSSLDDAEEAFVMTENMLTFVLGSVGLFLAAILLILIFATCARLYRRRQEQREQEEAASAAAAKNNGAHNATKPYIYPVRSLDFSRKQLDEILSKRDPRSNPLDF